jgi:molybdenum cofactor guanylyltransferase
LNYRNDITVIILSGGKSSRMGTDKGLLDLNGKPMIQHVLDVAKKITDNIIVSSNQDEYLDFGSPVVKDEVTDVGPMGGIYSCLSRCKTSKNLVLTCDSPLVTEELLTKLIDNGGDELDVVYYAHEANVYPLTAIYDKRILPNLKMMIDEGNFRMKALFENVNCKKVPFTVSEQLQLSNINTQEDLSKIA